MELRLKEKKLRQEGRIDEAAALLGKLLFMCHIFLGLVPKDYA